MGRLLGTLGLSDTDRSFIEVVGQRVVWETAQQTLTWYREYQQQIQGIFVSGRTEDHTFRYYRYNTGYLQKAGGLAQPHARRVSGSWDVGFPLEDFRDQVAADDISVKYMTVQEYDRQFDGVLGADANTRRYQILRALFLASSYTYNDPIKGSVTVQPLANGDSTLYPPVYYNTTEATHDHLLESGYAPASISDTNNPLVTLRNTLVEHRGFQTIGTNIVVFINSAQRAKVEALTDFTEVNDPMIRVGDNTAVPIMMPDTPGEVIGRCSNCWVVVWDWIPANYMVAIDPEQGPPLMERVDPAYTGIEAGLNLIFRGNDAEHPFEQSIWRDRFGYGVADRLSAAIMFLDASNPYVTPTAYA